MTPLVYTRPTSKRDGDRHRALNKILPTWRTRWTICRLLGRERRDRLNVLRQRERERDARFEALFLSLSLSTQQFPEKEKHCESKTSRFATFSIAFSFGANRTTIRPPLASLIHESMNPSLSLFLVSLLHFEISSFQSLLLVAWYMFACVLPCFSLGTSHSRFLPLLRNIPKSWIQIV